MILVHLHLTDPETGAPMVLRLAPAPGYRTGPADTPANEPYLPLVDRASNYGRTLGGLGRAGGTNGTVRLRGETRELEPYWRHGWVRAEILEAAPGASLSAAATLLRAPIRGVDWGGAHVTVRLTDPLDEADRPVLTHRFAGTGGLDGGEDLTDRPIPQQWGWCQNVPLILVDHLLQIYRAGLGPYRAIAPLEGMIPVTVDRDVGAAIDDPGLSIPAGACVTDLARGYVRLEFTPSRVMTADVEAGDPAAYVEDAGGIAEALVRDVLGWPAERIDATALAAFRTAAPARMGLDVADSLTAGSALDILTRGASGHWSIGPTGIWRVWRRTAAPAAVTAEIAPRLGGQLPAGRDPQAPVWRVEVRWGRNPTVLTPEQMGAVSEATRSWVAAPDRAAVAEDPTIHDRWPDADELTIDTRLTDRADAEALAAHLLTLFGQPRLIWTYTGRAADLAGFDLLDGVRLVWPRWSLDAGADTVCVGRSARDDATVQIQLWGSP